MSLIETALLCLFSFAAGVVVAIFELSRERAKIIRRRQKGARP
jgi:hypothetical protein